MSGAEPQEFYVGYLGVPPGQRRWLRLVVPAMLWGMCALAALIGLSVPNSGSGTWTTSETAVIEGVLALEPYPVVRSDDGRSMLLVEVGKMPLREGMDGLDGLHIRAEGFALERDGLEMLELLPGEGGIHPTGNRGGAGFGVRDEPRGRATLRGEIVDSKCYSGAMKPGTGLTHRACATLCVSQGIPPILLVNAPGGPIRLLLTDENGNRANELVLDHIGTEVIIEGERVRRGSLEYLRIGPDSIRHR